MTSFETCFYVFGERKTLDEIIAEYGDGALFASGLIVDGLHYFNDNLWAACDSVINKNIPLTGNREQVLLKKYWVDRAKRFAKNYFNIFVSVKISVPSAILGKRSTLKSAKDL